VKEIETLKGNLEEKTNQYEELTVKVEKEKEEIKAILKAKRDVEVACANLENQIEELQVAKKSKFMCF
jgi:hypothetical protein